MNRDEILVMPNAKLNQIIWWKVFDMNPTPPNNDMLQLPDYAGEIVSAWMVVTRLNEIGFSTRIEYGNQSYGEVLCMIWAKNLNEQGPYPISIRARTFPLAICQAAAIAFMVQDNEGRSR